jgi:hypothetical protein
MVESGVKHHNHNANPFKPSMYKCILFGFRRIVITHQIVSNDIENREIFQTRFEISFLVFNATFNNISAISWRPVLVVEEAEYLERTADHGQATGKLYHLRLRVECTILCNLQSRKYCKE